MRLMACATLAASCPWILACAGMTNRGRGQGYYSGATSTLTAMFCACDPSTTPSTGAISA